MGFMDRFKKMLLKSKPKTPKLSKVDEKEDVVSSTQTRYGKELNLSLDEKSKLVESLTPREKETFFILLGGYSLRETAEQLNVGYSTANTYQTAIYKKLKVNSRAELIINYRDMCETKED